MRLLPRKLLFCELYATGGTTFTTAACIAIFHSPLFRKSTNGYTRYGYRNAVSDRSTFLIAMAASPAKKKSGFTRVLISIHADVAHPDRKCEEGCSFCMLQPVRYRCLTSVLPVGLRGRLLSLSTDRFDAGGFVFHASTSIENAQQFHK